MEDWREKVTQNLKLVDYFLWKYGMTKNDDMRSEANMGLITAARRWKEGMGAKFTTYASIRIRGAILDTFKRWSQTKKEVELTFDPRGRKERDVFADTEEVEWMLRLAHLTPREDYVIRASILEGRALASLSRGMDISDSRVCQLRETGLKKLRGIVKPPRLPP